MSQKPDVTDLYDRPDILDFWQKIPKAGSPEQEADLASSRIINRLAAQRSRNKLEKPKALNEA